MRGFYLLKPDMFTSQEALAYYMDYVKNNDNIKSTEFYEIPDWITLSKILYEPNNNIPLEELKKIRMQMLVSIKGYDLFYKDKGGLLNCIDIKDPTKLQELFDFKKELRRRYVYQEKKNYIQFLNDINLERKLIDIDLSQMDCLTRTVEHDEEIEDPNYHLIFFNKIHFPDPTIEAIERDLDCIDYFGVTKAKNLIKRLN